MAFHSLWRTENTHNVKYNTSFDEPPIAVSKLFNLAVHWPSKVWPVGMIARKICSTIELKGIFLKIHYFTGNFIPKRYLSLVSYDNGTLKISKSKKSEQYSRDTIEIFFCLLDGRRTVPQISLETPPPRVILRFREFLKIRKTKKMSQSSATSCNWASKVPNFYSLDEEGLHRGSQWG